MKNTITASELSKRLEMLTAAASKILPGVDASGLMRSKHRTPAQTKYLAVLEYSALRLFGQSKDRAWRATAEALREARLGGTRSKPAPAADTK
jgi:hypothetical protein